MKFSLHHFTVILLLSIFSHITHAQEIYISISSGTSLIANFDPTFGQVDIVRDGSNIVAYATPKIGAEFRGWGTLGFANRCDNKQPRCIIPVSVLQAATVQPRIQGVFAGGTAYIFLHGLASNPKTWDGVVQQYFPNSCTEIRGGTFSTSLSKPLSGSYCFRVAFESYRHQGLENAACRNGDGSNYVELGNEVSLAVALIAKTSPLFRKIVLVGHSRGGLAARSALTSGNPYVQAKVKALLTIGTPHQGSAFGRVYWWLNKNIRPLAKSCRLAGVSVYCNVPGANGVASEVDRAQAWSVADRLRSLTNVLSFVFPTESLDVRCPTIGDLAIGSSGINWLNGKQLPVLEQYATITSGGKVFGDGGKVNLLMGGGLLPTMPISAQNAILDVYHGNTIYSYQGDGIVHRASQEIPNVRINYRTDLTGILHADETGQISYISQLLYNLR